MSESSRNKSKILVDKYIKLNLHIYIFDSMNSMQKERGKFLISGSWYYSDYIRFLDYYIKHLFNLGLRTTSSYLSTSKIWMLFINVDDIIIIIARVACTHLHVIHHELVAQLGPVLSVRHLFVHQAVEDS